MDIQHSNYGYLKIELWISKNRIMDIQKSAFFRISKILFEDIFKLADLRISINRFKDIHKSNYGYPKFRIFFGYPKMHIMISKMYLWIS